MLKAIWDALWHTEADSQEINAAWAIFAGFVDRQVRLMARAVPGTVAVTPRDITTLLSTPPTPQAHGTKPIFLGSGCQGPVYKLRTVKGDIIARKVRGCSTSVRTCMFQLHPTMYQTDIPNNLKPPFSCSTLELLSRTCVWMGHVAQLWKWHWQLCMPPATQNVTA